MIKNTTREVGPVYGPGLLAGLVIGGGCTGAADTGERVMYEGVKEESRVK